MELPETSTVNEFWTVVIERYPALGKFRNQSRVAVNMEYVEATCKLSHGDELIIVPPVSGG